MLALVIQDIMLSCDQDAMGCRAWAVPVVDMLCDVRGADGGVDSSIYSDIPRCNLIIRLNRDGRSDNVDVWDAKKRKSGFWEKSRM